MMPNCQSSHQVTKYQSFNSIPWTLIDTVSSEQLGMNYGLDSLTRLFRFMKNCSVYHYEGFTGWGSTKWNSIILQSRYKCILAWNFGLLASWPHSWKLWKYSLTGDHVQHYNFQTLQKRLKSKTRAMDIISKIIADKTTTGCMWQKLGLAQYQRKELHQLPMQTHTDSKISMPMHNCLHFSTFPSWSLISPLFHYVRSGAPLMGLSLSGAI